MKSENYEDLSKFQELERTLFYEIKSGKNNADKISNLIDQIGINAEIYGTPILQQAIKHNLDSKIIKMILDKKPNLRMIDTSYNKAIHTASIENNIKVLLMLIVAGADINSKNNRSWTPLHYASYYGNLEAIRILIEAGADRNIKNTDDKTALDVAYKNKNEVQNLFKQYGDRTVEPSTTLGGIKTHEVLSVKADLVHSINGSLSGR